MAMNLKWELAMTIRGVSHHLELCGYMLSAQENCILPILYLCQEQIMTQEGAREMKVCAKQP